MRRALYSYVSCHLLPLGIVLGLESSSSKSKSSNGDEGKQNKKSKAEEKFEHVFEKEEGRHSQKPAEGAVVMQNGRFTFSDDVHAPDRIVVGKFWDLIETTGNSRLHTSTQEHSSATDGDYFYGLGFAEGYLTAERVSQQVYNRVRRAKKTSPRVWLWMRRHNEYIRKTILQNALSDPYWFNMQLQMVRLDGLLAGYHYRRISDEEKNVHRDREDELDRHVNLIELFMINAVSDIEAVDRALKRQEFDDILSDDDSEYHVMDLDQQLRKWEEEAGMTTSRIRDVSYSESADAFPYYHGGDEATAGLFSALPKSAFPSKRRQHESKDELSVFPSETGQSDHCSALVKVAHGELYMGHATWTDYSEMLRIFKTLEYKHIKHLSVPTTGMSYSSYPGYLSSTDDWFVMQPTRLVVTETTLDVESDEILAQYVTVRSVLTPIRALVASTMAESGLQWYDIFSMHNSGTQNDQWHVVDFKKFTRGNPSLNIPANLEPGIH